jgi:hypothetical protein
MPMTTSGASGCSFLACAVLLLESLRWVAVPPSSLDLALRRFEISIRDNVKRTKEYLLLAFGSIGALNIELIFLIGGMLAVGVCLVCDIVVGAELTTAAVTAC